MNRKTYMEKRRLSSPLLNFLKCKFLHLMLKVEAHVQDLDNNVYIKTLTHILYYLEFMMISNSSVEMYLCFMNLKIRKKKTYHVFWSLS